MEQQRAASDKKSQCKLVVWSAWATLCLAMNDSVGVGIGKSGQNCMSENWNTIPPCRRVLLCNKYAALCLHHILRCCGELFVVDRSVHGANPRSSE